MIDYSINTYVTITFKNNNNVLVYAFEKLLLFSREHQYLFAAHCIRWLASLTRLQQGLTIYINNIQESVEVGTSKNKPEPSLEIDTSKTDCLLSPNNSSLQSDPLRNTRKHCICLPTPPKKLTKNQNKKLIQLNASKSLKDKLELDQKRQEYFKNRI